MADTIERLKRLAVDDVRALVSGESGAGVEWLCKKIHAESARAAAPYVVLHAGAIPPARHRAELEETLRQSRGGTLVVRSIENLESAEQRWLLSAANEQRLVVTRYANLGVEPNAVLEPFTVESFSSVAVPSLRERSVDIPELSSVFWRTCNAATASTVEPLTHEEVAELLLRDWPGNARDLRNHLVLEHQRRRLRTN